MMRSFIVRLNSRLIPRRLLSVKDIISESEIARKIEIDNENAGPVAVSRVLPLKSGTFENSLDKRDKEMQLRGKEMQLRDKEIQLQRKEIVNLKQTLIKGNIQHTMYFV